MNLDRITYETHAPDGCRLAHILDVGEESLQRDPHAAQKLIDRLLEWRRLAMGWHDEGNHEVAA